MIVSPSPRKDIQAAKPKSKKICQVINFSDGDVLWPEGHHEQQGVKDVPQIYGNAYLDEVKLTQIGWWDLWQNVLLLCKK